jgi:hypothetical protein
MDCSIVLPIKRNSRSSTKSRLRPSIKLLQAQQSQSGRYVGQVVKQFKSYQEQKEKLRVYLKSRENFMRKGFNVQDLLFDSNELWRSRDGVNHYPMGKRDRTAERLREHRGLDSEPIRAELKKKTRDQLQQDSLKASLR